MQQASKQNRDYKIELFSSNINLRMSNSDFIDTEFCFILFYLVKVEDSNSNPR